MDDFDDYFDDDIVFDEQTLAALDAEVSETIAQSQCQPTPAPLQPTPPATKRQKTDYGWRPGIGSLRTDSLEDLDDLPEISVRLDGTYGLGSSVSTSTPHTASTSYAPINASVIPQSKPFVRVAPNTTTGSRQPVRPTPTRTPSLNSANNRPLQSTSQRQSPHIPTISNGAQTHIPNQRHSSGERVPLSTSTVQVPASLEAEALRVQLEELQKQTSKYQSALKDEQDIRMAREGEVSILRKSIEKTAKDHAAQVAKLKAAKDEADAKQAQAHKDTKEEIERLKTQFTFKHHELETSVRKPPWTHRSKRINKDPFTVTVEVPSQIRNWTKDEKPGEGPSTIVAETPHRGRLGSLESPKVAPSRKKYSPEDGRKLPGFQNSFAPTSPVRPLPPHYPKDVDVASGELRGKGKEKEQLPFFRSQSQFTNSGHPLISPPTSPSRPNQTLEPTEKNICNVDAADPDDLLYDQIEIDVRENADRTSANPDLSDGIAEPLNWGERLHHVILSHISPPCTVSTFQTLMRLPLPLEAPSSTKDRYTAACSQILELLASKSEPDEWESAVRTVSESFSEMAEVLHITDLTSPLVSLLNLSTLLIFSLPSIATSFLISPGAESSPRIFSVIFDIIRDRLIPTSPTNTLPDIDLLAQEAVALLEALCWNVADELEGCLALIPRSPRVLDILLDPSQSTSLLNQSVRLLIMLASRPNLFRHLLAYPESDASTSTNDYDTRDFSRIPHIERLCEHLVGTMHHDTEADISLKTLVLTFFSTLSVAHSDAVTFLAESQTLVPSIVLFLTQLAPPLWDDDESAIAAPRTSSSVRTIAQAIFLLHYLVFSGESTCNLRHKLLLAPHRQFNGIQHMFIVTFGRMSYADAPCWIQETSRQELEQIAEMARDLLDLVVEGPESDSIWATYQDEIDQDIATDDEEMEAQLLDSVL